MSQKVKVSDYEHEQHLLKTLLNLVGLTVDYVTADLIHSAFAKFKEKKGKTDLTDAVSIKIEHERKWEEYFQKQKETNPE